LGRVKDFKVFKDLKDLKVLRWKPLLSTPNRDFNPVRGRLRGRKFV
jgi:hypothetical protein